MGNHFLKKVFSGFPVLLPTQHPEDIIESGDIMCQFSVGSHPLEEAQSLAVATLLFELFQDGIAVFHGSIGCDVSKVIFQLQCRRSIVILLSLLLRRRRRRRRRDMVVVSGLWKSLPDGSPLLIGFRRVHQMWINGVNGFKSTTSDAASIVVG